MEKTVQWEKEYPFGRPMSDFEILMNEFHRRDLWILLRTLVVSCEEKTTLEHVNEALCALMKWNPSLRMGIQKNSDGKWEFKEQLEAQPRLECLFNEKEFKKVRQKKEEEEIRILFFYKKYW